MIAPEIEDGIVHLAREASGGRPLSNRGIARLVGVSRGTVQRVIRYGPRHRPAEELPENTPPIGTTIGDCPVHGRVRMPCLACWLLARLPRAARIRTDDGPEGPIRIELRGPERLRYEQLRRAKAAAGELGPYRDEPEGEDAA
jgi:hypothetical protein